MKKNYENIDIAIVKLESTDVVTTSAEVYDPSSTYDKVIDNWDWTR